MQEQEQCVHDVTLDVIGFDIENWIQRQDQADGRKSERICEGTCVQNIVKCGICCKNMYYMNEFIS